MKKLTPLLLVIAGAGIAAMVVMFECGHGPSAPPHLLKASELTPAEIKFGRSPKRDRSVTYQPDVVLVENGSEAMHSLGADGFTCVLDAKTADNADDLVVGKIAFVTGRCVGRILHVQRASNELTLLLGPVELTDIFRKLEVDLNQPVDFSQALEYPTLQLPEMNLPLEGPDAALPERSAVPQIQERFDALLSAPRMPTIQPAAFFQAPGSVGILPTAPKVGFEAARPLVNADGIGAELRHQGRGVSLVAQAQLRMKTPRVEFHLSIDNGTIDAEVLLHNAAGLKLAFDSAVSDEFSGNVNWYWIPPGTLSIPLSGPVPLSIDARQEVWVQTVFSAKQSSFSAGGDYDINADFGVTYHNKRFSLLGPQGITVRKSMLNNMTGVSLGPRGLVISHNLIVTGGLGMGGFTTGPSLHIGTSVGAALGSNIGIMQCSTVSMSMNVRGGVGWTIPRPVAKFVNFFLHIVNVPPIPDHGGILSPWKRLFNKYAYIGDPQVCGSQGG